jgi:hypothetical protein
MILFIYAAEPGSPAGVTRHLIITPKDVHKMTLLHVNWKACKMANVRGWLLMQQMVSISFSLLIHAMGDLHSTRQR